MDEITIRITTTPAKAREFLELLAADPDFRMRVEREPQAVLTEYGIHVPDHALPKKVRLPQRDEIERRLTEMIEEDELGLAGHCPHGYAILFFVLGAMPLVDAR